MNHPDAPHLATLDDDGWTLQDAEDRLARGDDLYWLPDRWTRDHLEDDVPVGGHVKLLFVIHDPDHPSEPMIERMWVTLTGRDGEYYHGHLANEPETRGTAKEGMPVWFRAEHVIDYAGPNGEGRASESADAIRCSDHGISHACYVCAHLTMDTAKRGFNSANSEALRPDAWCDECQSEFARAGSWDDSEHEPEIKLICGGCYDVLRERHRRT